MKLLLQVCGIVLLFILMTIPVVADMSGTDILIHSPHITEDESTIEYGSGDTYYSYSNGFTFDGNLVVWMSYRLKKVPPKNFSSTLWMMNLTDGETRILATSPSPDHRYMFDTPFDIADGRVIWSEDFNIYAYDNTSRDVHALTSDGAHVDLSIQRENRDAVMDGDRVVWVKRKPSPSDDDGIVLYNLTSRTLQEFPVGPGRKSSPAMDGSRIVWSDKRKEPEGGDIYLFDLNRNEEISLCAASDIQQHPGISGNYVVWEDFRDGNPAIYLHNITSGMEYRISENNLLSLASMPYVSGNFAVWTEFLVSDKTRDESRRIIVYNILTGKRETFSPDTPRKVLWDFHDNRILYSDPDNMPLKEGYVHLYVIDTPAPDSLSVLASPVYGPENLTFTTEKPATTVPTRETPMTTSTLALGCICLVLWIRKLSKME